MSALRRRRRQARRLSPPVARPIAAALVCLYLVLYLVLALGLLAGCARTPVAPRAVDGRIDLTRWNFATSGDVVLRGTWEICWGELLEPGQACPTEWRVMPVPGLWTETGAEGPFGGHGVATYRLRIALPPGPGHLALAAGGPMTSYRLWIDGVDAGGVGVVARSAEQAAMGVRNRVYDIAPGEDEIDLLVQVANFEFRSGGLRRRWYLGESDSIRTGIGLATLREGMVFSVGVVVGLGYLALFLLGRSEQARGYFGLAALVLGLRAVPASITQFGALIAPWAGFELLTRFEYLGTALAIFAGAGYARTKVRGVAPPRTLEAIQLAALALGAIILFGSFSITQATLPIQYVLAIAVSGLFVYCYGTAWLRGVPGVGVTATASMLYALVIVHDILRTEESGFGFSFELYPYAMVLWILAEGFDLLRRFYDTFIKVESLSEALTEANFELQETESAIMRFVPFDFLRTLGKQSIREVDAGDRVRSEVSVLHCGFHARSDVTPSTSLEQGFDALSALVARAEPIVTRRGGFVNEFRGDGFQAFFPSGPTEAVAAALEIFEAIDALRVGPDPSGRVPVDIAIGVDTGSVLLGTVGGGEQLMRGIIGAAVDGARRVERAAHRHGGRVWISSATERALGDSRRVDVAPAPVSGISEDSLFEVHPPAKREGARP